MPRTGPSSHGSIREPAKTLPEASPTSLPALHLPGAIDGELLVLRERRVQTFNVLQQRLNRKSVTPKLMQDFPIHLRAYDLLGDGENDLRELPFEQRRDRLEAFVARLNNPRVDLSPQVPFASWEELAAARADPANANAGADAEAVEGVMLKRRDSAYMPGRPKGQWWKWKRDPHVIDAVLMSSPSAATANARHTTPTTPSASGRTAKTATNWCPSARPISASPTRS